MRKSTCQGPKAATAGKAVLAYGNSLDYTQLERRRGSDWFARARERETASDRAKAQRKR